MNDGSELKLINGMAARQDGRTTGRGDPAQERPFSFQCLAPSYFFLPKSWPDCWWASTFLHPAPIVIGREWHRKASEEGHAVRNKMQNGKVYLFQMYTICFVEFGSTEEAEEFVLYADRSIPHWRDDPVTIIDTRDPAVERQWEEYIEKEV